MWTCRSEPQNAIRVQAAQLFEGKYNEAPGSQSRGLSRLGPPRVANASPFSECACNASTVVDLSLVDLHPESKLQEPRVGICDARRASLSCIGSPSRRQRAKCSDRLSVLTSLHLVFWQSRLGPLQGYLDSLIVRQGGRHVATAALCLQTLWKPVN